MQTVRRPDNGVFVKYCIILSSEIPDILHDNDLMHENQNLEICIADNYGYRRDDACVVSP